jgi:hypothetical protein
MLHVLFAVALGSATVASDSRCNDIHINAIQGEIQNFASHPALAGQQAQRATAIVQAQSDAEQELVVLQGVCAENYFAPLAARIFALDAWADLLMQRNAAAAGGAPCPDADMKMMAAGAASAWYKLGQASSIPNPPKLVATLVPQTQALAAQAGVTLPSFADATTYWEQKYEAAAKAAIVNCGSQTPIPK